MSDQYSDVVECVGAVLSRRHGRLRVDWADGAVLELPDVWCRKADVSAVEEGPGIQIVLHFAPQAEDGRTTTSWMAVRLRADPGSSLTAHEFAKFLRHDLNLDDQLDIQEDDAESTAPRLTRVPHSHPDWISMLPGRESEELFDAIHQHLAPSAGS